MTHLIHLSHSSYIRDNVFMLDVAKQSALSGDTVKVLVCDATVNICKSNPNADKIFCVWCKRCRKKLLGDLPKSVEVLRYGDFYTPESRAAVDSFKFDYDSTDMIKKMTYKGVNIGYGAFSSYVSLTRNLYPNMNGAFRNYFDRYLKAECVLTEVIGNVFDKISPDMVSIYNGRHFETRPVFEFSMRSGCQTRCYENVRTGKDKRKNYIYFENALPHDIKTMYNLMMKTWDDADLPEDEKKATGVSFFENRKASVFAGDKVYTRNQKYGIMPDGFDKSKRNIAVFVSSEDEFASIGEEYDKDQVFSSQQRGIAEILEHFKNDANIRFYIRIHPNLQKVKYRYHTSLIELADRYANAVVIKADDTISSYSLLENTEKAIVFGSTIGLEACYWGKPVVLLCAAFYNYLDVVYKPETAEEAFALIGNVNLPAKDSTGALKYGFYSMYDRCENSRSMTDAEAKYRLSREFIRILAQMNIFRLRYPLKEAKV